MGKSDLPGCHRCGARPVFQWTRLADADEAATQADHIAVMQGRHLDGDEIAARYGPLRVAVAGCAEHHLGADASDPDGGGDRRALLHDAGCGGHGACECAPPASAPVGKDDPRRP